MGIAKVTLGNERFSLSARARCGGWDRRRTIWSPWSGRLAALGRHARERLVEVWIESQILRVLRLRTVSAVLAGKAPGPEASVRKAIADATGSTSWTSHAT